MELTRESVRTRRLVLLAAWTAVGVLIFLHALAMRDSIAVLDGLGLRGAAEPGTPLQRVMPTLFTDAQTWVRHALTLLETDAWRIRFTEIDNAPHGREVHWNSAFAWLIAAEGWLRHVVTGEPLPLAVERSLAWFNLPLLLGLVMLVSAWTARRAGAGAGLFVACAMVGSGDFYSGFMPNFADHHGVLAVAIFGVVLGTMFMGAGWWNPGNAARSVLLPSSREAARRAAIFSAVSGAVGCWVSAASVLPAIPIVGAAGLLVTVWHGRALRREGFECDPGLWRLWGRVGAGTSLAFYLLEYAPSHFGLRLEVNHPLYALAWWGGAEVVAQICERFLEMPAGRRAGWRLAAAGIAVAAPVLTILIGGAKVFIVRDPMIQEISARVAEGLSLRRAIDTLGPGMLLPLLPWPMAAMVPAAILIVRARRADKLLLGFGVITCLAFLGMGVAYVRFFASAGGPLICLVLACLAALAGGWSLRARWTLVVAMAAVALLPQQVYRIVGANRKVEARAVARLDLLQPLYRDIAATLRAAQPDGEIILLTNPDASTGIGYYGRLKTIGTLYWENLDGMKAAAAISAATSMDEARALLLERRATHVAVLSENSFVQEYFEMMNPGAKADEWRQCFAFQLFLKRALPLWLEEIPYEPPADIRIPDLRVVVFKTRFGAPAAEQAFQIARAHGRAGELRDAERAIDRALAADPASAEFWLLKGELLFARGALDAALAAIEQCLDAAPAANRAEIASTAGTGFYLKQAHAAAVRLYRRSLAAQYDPAAASNLGWILATSTDATLRDGRAALALAERAAAEGPDLYQGLSTLAAALAENGRFDEAATTAARALEVARAANDQNTAGDAEVLLKTYQSGKPWRQ